MNIQKAKVASVGGGLASFGFVDALRVNGVRARDIAVIGPNKKPYGTFAERCLNSGIGYDDRLRSDSSATPGNLWGWPTFGFRELGGLLRHGPRRDAVKLASQLFCEPIRHDIFSPKLKQVVAAIDRECQRIDYAAMHQSGTVRSIVPEDSGWRITFKTPTNRTKHIWAEYLQLAIGYQANNAPSDKTKLNKLLGKHYAHVYEPHEQAIKNATKKGGVFIVRGRGIAASRVVERLLDIAEQQPKLKVIHVMQSEVSSGRGMMPVRRNRHVQPFNFSKSSFGGTQANTFASLEKEARAEYISRYGRTSTPSRNRWRQQMKKALKNGQYEIVVGNLSVTGKTIRLRTAGQPARELGAIAGLIDATGLVRQLDASPPIKSLYQQELIQIGPEGFIDMTNKFEARSPLLVQPNIFFGGSTALGGPYGPVDSFSGINFVSMITACEIVERLNLQAFSKTETVLSSTRYSVAAWSKWARGVQP